MVEGRVVVAVAVETAPAVEGVVVVVGTVGEVPEPASGALPAPLVAGSPAG